MNVEHLVHMANDIASFFDGEVGANEAPAGVALHLSRYWDFRMRRQIIEFVSLGGTGLSPSAEAAVRSLPPVSPTLGATG